jgi:hypothetical protein
MKRHIREAIEQAKRKLPGYVTPEYRQLRPEKSPPLNHFGPKGRVTPDGKMFCGGCGEYRFVSEFYVHRSKATGYFRYDSHCHDCRKKAMVAGRVGISLIEYRKLLVAADGLCALCRQSFGARPNIDHCHRTGKIRGVLCSRCNTGIALFLDSTELLNAAILYLRSAPSDPASRYRIVKTRSIRDR